MKLCVGALAALALAGCHKSEQVPGFNTFIEQVEHQQLGRGRDHWIETKNTLGDWERVGLIFGYVDDYAICQEAIAGLRRADREREYRCAPVNSEVGVAEK